MAGDTAGSVASETTVGDTVRLMQIAKRSVCASIHRELD